MGLADAMRVNELAQAEACHDEAIALNEARDAAEQAATPIIEVGKATEDAAKKSQEASEGFGELKTKLAEIASVLGVGIGLEEIGREALTAYAGVERADIALTFLTKDAAGAASTIERLKELSMSDALSFPDLLQAQVRMTAFGFSAASIPPLMQAAADTAAGTFRDFDSVTNAIERMALGGLAGGRQLATLGISAEDLGKALGVTGSEAQKAFKALDVADRVEKLTEALQKFHGAAAAMADSLTGQWQKFQNQLHFTMEEIGKFGATDANQFLGWMQGVAESAEKSVKGLELLLEVLNRMTPQLGNVGAAIDFLHLKTAMFAGALGGPIAGLLALGLGSNKLVNDTLDGAEKLDNAWEKFLPKKADLDAAEAGMSAFAKAVQDTITRIISVEADAQKTYAATKEAYEAIYNSWLSGKALADGHVATLRDVKSAMEQLNGATEAAGKGHKEFVDSLKESIAPLDLSGALYAEDSIHLAALWQNINFANEALKAAQDIYDADSTKAGQYYAALSHLKTLYVELDDLLAKGAPTMQFGPSIAQASVEVEKFGSGIRELPPYIANVNNILKSMGLTVDEASGEVSTKMVKGFMDLAASGRATLPEMEAGFAKASASASRLGTQDLPILIKAQETYINWLRETHQAQGLIEQTQAALYTSQIKLAAQNQTTANTQIIGLQNIKLHMDALDTALNFTGHLYVSLTDNVKKAFDQMGAGIAHAIIDFHNFGKDIKQTGEQIAEMFLTTMIQAVIKWASAIVINALLGGAAMKASAIAGQQAYATEGAVAAGASVAAIPLIGWAMVEEVTAATYAFLAGFGAATSAIGAVIETAGEIPSFDTGGYVGQDMLAMVHKGEYVVPADVVSASGGLSSGATAGGGLVIQNCTFHGVTDQTVSTVANQLVKAARRAGMKW